MPIIDEELFVKCRGCGHEIATGIRRSERALAEAPPGERTLPCPRCGRRDAYGGSDFYHRTVDANRRQVEV